MKRRHVAILAFAACVAAAALLVWPDRVHHGLQSPSEDEARRDATTGSPDSVNAPPAAPPSLDAQPPAPVAPKGSDGVALRDEADRLIAAGRVMEGLDVFRRAVAADPTAKNHGDLGSLLYRLTALDEAITHLRAAAELDPMNADRWIALANAYYRKVDLGEAWKAEEKAREAEPGLELARDASGMRIRKGDKAPREP